MEEGERGIDVGSLADTLRSVIASMGWRNGFAWWLPILTAVIAALIAVGVSRGTASAWDADVHLWARDGRTAAEYAELVLDGSVQDAATSGMMASKSGLPVLDGVAIVLNDTLIRVTVRSAHEADAEALAISLGHAAVNESINRYGDQSGLDMLGLVRPGARQVAPTTEWTAAWASAAGLAIGLALAWAVSTRSTSPSRPLGRLGRLGLRPITVISSDAERAAQRTVTHSRSATVDPIQEQNVVSNDAVMLANALNPVAGVVALTPLDATSDVTATLIHTAQVLASRGRSVVWLDSRRPAFEVSYGEPPSWLTGAQWWPVPRRSLIIRNAHSAKRGDRTVMLLTDPLSEPSTAEVGQAADGVILLARADASDEQLIHAQQLLSGARILGVAMTHADAPDIRDFELAQMSE